LKVRFFVTGLATQTQNPFYVIWTYSMDETSPKWKDEEEKGSAGESRELIGLPSLSLCSYSSTNRKTTTVLHLSFL
jgi:hypothetical protein